MEKKIEWYDIPRLENTKNRLSNRLIKNNIEVINLEYGINLYRNAIPKDQCLSIIDRLERGAMSESFEMSWNGAQVNDKEDTYHVRNCVDIKYKREHLGTILKFDQDMFDIHKEVEDALDKCLEDYQSLWHLQMFYKEAFNFVKYLPGKYFKLHGDHGPYYSCTISAVVYLNDNYTGGEIEFPRQLLKIKPKAGDIIIFPSNFVYEHSSHEIFDGTKYSVVIMTDYNDLHHKSQL
jgi:hypothetical protein